MTERLQPAILKAIRKQMRLSQEQMAGHLGISRVAYNNWEGGKLTKGLPLELPGKLLKLRDLARAGVLLATKRLDATVQHVAAPKVADAPKAAVVTTDAELWENEEEEV